MKYVFCAIVCAIIILPRLLIDMSLNKAALSDITSKPFVCPNCGCKFYRSWYRLIFKKYSVYTYGYAKFKCPSCGIRDMCRHED